MVSFWLRCYRAAMRPPIDDGIVLVTGASSGLGREIATQLAGRARTLILVARRQERLEELAAQLRKEGSGRTIAVRPADLGDLAAADSMISDVVNEFGPIDILVNNAGFGDMALFDRSDWSKMDQMIRVNISALTLLSRRVIESMVDRKRGGILNVSSGLGLTFMPGFGAYAATKHYVTALTEALRLEHRKTGVVITQLCPGPVATEFEGLTGNPTEHSVPKFLEISAERCARVALRAFERDRAMVTPGFWAKVMIGLGRISPRLIYRLAMRPVAGELRKLPPTGDHH